MTVDPKSAWTSGSPHNVINKGMPRPPAIAQIDREGRHAHHRRRADKDDDQDFQAEQPKKLAVIDNRKNGGREEHEHFGEEPLRAAAHAGEADATVRQQDKRKGHADHAAERGVP